MSKFQKVYNGGTFGPGMNFPKRCLFKNCTFRAPCKFQEDCYFINCKFVRWAPPYYTNPWSEVKKAIMENCTLDYVKVDAQTTLKNCKPIAASVAGRMNPPGRALGNTIGKTYTLTNTFGGIYTTPKGTERHPGCGCEGYFNEEYEGG